MAPCFCAEGCFFDFGLSELHRFGQPPRLRKAEASGAPLWPQSMSTYGAQVLCVLREYA